MGRPRKNRLGEYAELFGGELQRLLSEELVQVVEESQAAYHTELESLRKEVRQLTKQVDALTKKAKAPKQKVGKWVPGGPGRPPKDASERIAAFESRKKTKD